MLVSRNFQLTSDFSSPPNFCNLKVWKTCSPEEFDMYRRDLVQVDVQSGWIDANLGRSDLVQRDKHRGNESRAQSAAATTSMYSKGVQTIIDSIQNKNTPGVWAWKYEPTNGSP
eukprot:466440-Hanusia_phi.AAC.1